MVRSKVTTYLFCALGVGLIAVLVVVSMSLEEKWGRWEELGWNSSDVVKVLMVSFCAGIGGAICTTFFGRTKDQLWKTIGVVFFGAVFATVCGTMIAGSLVLFASGGSFKGIIFGLVIGPLGTFRYILGTASGTLSWIVGFALLDILMRWRRQAVK